MIVRADQVELLFSEAVELEDDDAREALAVDIARAIYRRERGKLR